MEKWEQFLEHEEYERDPRVVIKASDVKAAQKTLDKGMTAEESKRAVDLAHAKKRRELEAAAELEWMTDQAFREWLGIEAPPEGVLDKIAATAGGLSAFIIRLAALRKAGKVIPRWGRVPRWMQEAIVWETENQLSGGADGAGAAMALGLQGIARLPIRTPFKLALESAAFGELAAVHGGDEVDIYINMAIPGTLRGINKIALAARLRGAPSWEEYIGVVKEIENAGQALRAEKGLPPDYVPEPKTVMGLVKNMIAQMSSAQKSQAASERSAFRKTVGETAQKTGVETAVPIEPAPGALGVIRGRPLETTGPLTGREGIKPGDPARTTPAAVTPAGGSAIPEPVAPPLFGSARLPPAPYVPQEGDLIRGDITGIAEVVSVKGNQLKLKMLSEGGNVRESTLESLNKGLASGKVTRVGTSEKATVEPAPKPEAATRVGAGGEVRTYKTRPAAEKYARGFEKERAARGFEKERAEDGLAPLEVVRTDRGWEVREPPGPAVRGGGAVPEPVKAYHGTKAEFGEFDPAFQGSATDAGFLGKAFYFSEWDRRRVPGEGVLLQ
jgi:hypothetical protein